MVRTNHPGIAIETGFRIKGIRGRLAGLETVLHASQHRQPLRVPPVLAPASRTSTPRDTELTRFERLCNVCQPHQALGQSAPMQAYSQNLNRTALAARTVPLILSSEIF